MYNISVGNMCIFEMLLYLKCQTAVECELDSRCFRYTVEPWPA